MLHLNREPVQARQSIRSEIYAQRPDISVHVPRVLCLVRSCKMCGGVEVHHRTFAQLIYANFYALLPLAAVGC